MWWDIRRPWTVLVPPLTAGGAMLLFFAVFDRWDKLENPVQSQIAILSALGGFLAGIAAQRITNWWLAAVPFALAAGILIWAYYFPNDNPSDDEFRQILFLLGAVALLAAVALNIPQIVRGRGAASSRNAETEA